MAKYCTKCGTPIFGKARKYCPNCKRLTHLNQMNLYYIAHTDRYQYGGIYWQQQSENRCGTGSLGEHRLTDFTKEQDQINKELRNLQLREQKENWRYKND